MASRLVNVPCGQLPAQVQAELTASWAAKGNDVLVFEDKSRDNLLLILGGGVLLLAAAVTLVALGLVRVHEVTAWGVGGTGLFFAAAGAVTLIQRATRAIGDGAYIRPAFLAVCHGQSATVVPWQEVHAVAGRTAVERGFRDTVGGWVHIQCHGSLEFELPAPNVAYTEHIIKQTAGPALGAHKPPTQQTAEATQPGVALMPPPPELGPVVRVFSNIQQGQRAPNIAVRIGKAIGGGVVGGLAGGLGMMFINEWIFMLPVPVNLSIIAVSAVVGLVVVFHVAGIGGHVRYVCAQGLAEFAFRGKTSDRVPTQQAAFAQLSHVHVTNTRVFKGGNYRRTEFVYNFVGAGKGFKIRGRYNEQTIVPPGHPIHFARAAKTAFDTYRLVGASGAMATG